MLVKENRYPANQPVDAPNSYAVLLFGILTKKPTMKGKAIEPKAIASATRAK